MVFKSPKSLCKRQPLYGQQISSRYGGAEFLYYPLFFNICDLEKADQTELNQAAAVSLKNALTSSQQTLEKAKLQFGDMDFETSSQKLCQALTKQNKDHLGLCEEPLNNLSWIYSAHYLWMEKDQ